MSCLHYSSNNADSRTEALKGFSPKWNKEIVLAYDGTQGDLVGLNAVSSVMVLLRDAASGILKHSHIGQVIIPIACFLSDTEADLCLPLEPSHRCVPMFYRYDCCCCIYIYGFTFSPQILLQFESLGCP